MAKPRYLVGIDLGTTHTLVAYTDLSRGPEAPVERFAIPQLIAPGELAERPLLPSVRYHPAEGELNPEEIRLPWPPVDIGDPVPHPVIGELARRLGAKSLGRLVTSAKSWLCNDGVDRLADILPWGSPPEVPKVSPLTASASYLAHVRGAWNYRFPDHPLETQEVIVTVPASFDEAARTLTVEAARRAGLSRIRLLEEPQAVCYDWLHRHRGDLSPIADRRLLLVVDLGGGTTDLTLIAIAPGDGQPELTRIGIGDHLLLGGDNIDLMLAHLAEERLLDQGHKLSPADFAQLVEQCRLAKERLLAEGDPESATVTILGGGRRLIGAARAVTFTREEVRRIVLDGFFPEVSLQDHPEGVRSGLVEFGLPYVADPAVTRHIAAFLSHHRRAAAQALGNAQAEPVPDAILLNGGVFLSPVITERLLAVVSRWGRTSIRRLDNPHPDFAVAAGAVAYGLARRGLQPRIGGGSPRSYFLVVENETGQPQGVCLLPRGAEEEREVLLRDRRFALRLGRPVRFHLVATSDDITPVPGEVLPLDSERFAPLPPLVLALAGEDQGEIQVRLAARLTEVGTLELDCVAVDDPEKRWQLTFELRRQPLSHKIQDASHPHLDEALGLIRQVFGRKSRDVSPKLVKSLRAELEKRLGPRQRWDMPLLRELADALLEGRRFRRRSAEHERAWLGLTGFCLRPGFGYPLDDWRIDQLWPLYAAGLQFVNVIQNWAEWWTFWRRLAGGLDAHAQESLYADIRDYLDPVKSRKGKLATLSRQRSYENIVRLAAVLEHLPPSTKTELGRWLLKRLQSPKEPEQTAWALGRVGSRVPFYGSAHNCVPREEAEDWLRQLLTMDFRKRPLLGFAAALLARRCGDRSRDVDPQLREAVIAQLKQAKAPASWIAMVSEVAELSAEDEQRLFGEALPPGLKLIA
ncbi:hypothetical protein MIN45_P1464 [Methylomarinovum tepidoasis]|uniref:Molecular chaperone DnaK n=1 Tax=Methylomarinovum tepidoasis TaxID=2840183 RepID=A0AAU9D278_9GAMM|nr:Hsp70 family protein [Methylomarinovum sp. IN45]BCX89094.1 hypothetical protein MIN45_P1464 [Methylomarinovum sp. IN45]